MAIPRRKVCAWVFVVAASISSGVLNRASAAEPDAAGGDLVVRGEYLARASDCTACHTAPGGKPFAGGLAIASPVGVIYATNITPSVTSGLGRYTEVQFADALRRGIRADGANLYSAMPYTSYSLLTDDDVKALYAYFMNSVSPVDEAAPATTLAFPLSIRASMKIWNLLFLNEKTFEYRSDQSAEMNRGRYLVTGPAHCSACHTPRGFLMEEKTGSAFGGGLVSAWYAPNVTPDPVSGIGTWSHADLVQYLQTGSVASKAQAAGSMAEAVEDSFQYLTPSDLSAMATYIESVAPIGDAKDSVQRSAVGHASSEVALLRGRTGVSADRGSPTGSELFQANCASCHSFAGQGSHDGYYPSLFNNSTVGATNANNLIATILNGVNRTTAQGQVFMPGFGGKNTDLTVLSDSDIALLATDVIAEYGGGGRRVDAEQVAVTRRGGPSSPIVWLAQIATGLAVLVAIVLIGWTFVRVRRR